jgi:hypothetical protein
MAAHPQSTPGLVTLPAIADTWAWRSFNPPTSPPPAVHGAETALITGIDDTRGTQLAYLRFDLSRLPGPPTRVKEATLRLSVGGESPRSEPRASDLHAVLQPWEEATLADEQVPAIGPVLATAFPDQGGGVAWNVTELVSGWQQGAANHGMAISSAHDLFFTRRFASREARSGQPVLEVWMSYESMSTPPTSTPTTPTPTATRSPSPQRADLTGIGSYACFQSGIHVTVYNHGLADAGWFIVRSASGRPGWRVTGLMAGAELRLPAQSGSATGMTVDADDEVLESNESNNLVTVGIPQCTMKLIFPLVVRGR